MVAADVATQAELDAVGTAATNAATAAGLKLAGDVVKSVHVETTAQTVLSTVIPFDNTIPQITEGTQVLTASITPASASNILQIDVCVYASETSNISDYIMTALFRNGAADAIAADIVASMGGGANFLQTGRNWIRIRVTAGATTPQTFTVRTGSNNGAITLNGATAAATLGGIIRSWITITELVPNPA